MKVPSLEASPYVETQVGLEHLSSEASSAPVITNEAYSVGVTILYGTI